MFEAGPVELNILLVLSVAKLRRSSRLIIFQHVVENGDESS